jgi:hypothetical protein
MNLTSSQLRQMGACIREQGPPAAGEKKTRKRRPTPLFDQTSSRCVSSVSVWLAIRTVSEMNQREMWYTRNDRKKAQQAIVSSKANDFEFAKRFVPGPYRIKLTRVGPRPLDSDNAEISMKHIRDQIAKLLCINDGDESKATWKVDQMKQPFYSVRVHIETLKA